MSPIRMPVEEGHILAFARAVGDDAPGSVAPPTFTVAAAQHDSEFALRPRPGIPWHGSGRTPTGDPGREVEPRMHAEQHFSYHAPVLAGDVLTITSAPGRTWDKRGSASWLHFSETVTEHRNQRGELAVTSRLVSVTLRPLQ